jgi:dTDP-4-amino-4,6-dideoxygalactose transaminase
VGSVNPIYYVGARPCFIDSESTSWNMDASRLKQCLEPIDNGTAEQISTIMVVHSYGIPAEWNDILKVASRHQLKVIEDAAAGLGASYKGQPVGTLGDLGVLSFNNNKTFTTFGGGAIIVKSKEQYDAGLYLSTHANSGKPYYEHHQVGYNYRMSSLNAAFGLADLDNLSFKLKRRNEIFEFYKHSLAGYVEFPSERPDVVSSRWLTTILLPKRNNPIEVRKDLLYFGIETRPLWNPMHVQPAFAKELSFGGDIAIKLFSSGLCLPSGSSLSDQQVNEVATRLKQVIEGNLLLER